MNKDKKTLEYFNERAYMKGLPTNTIYLIDSEGKLVGEAGTKRQEEGEGRKRILKRGSGTKEPVPAPFIDSAGRVKEKHLEGIRLNKGTGKWEECEYSQKTKDRRVSEIFRDRFPQAERIRMDNEFHRREHGKDSREYEEMMDIYLKIKREVENR